MYLRITVKTKEGGFSTASLSALPFVNLSFALSRLVPKGSDHRVANPDILEILLEREMDNLLTLEIVYARSFEDEGVFEKRR